MENSTILPNSNTPRNLFNQKQKSWSRVEGGGEKKKKATRSGRATTSVERETAEEGNTVEEQKGRKTSSVE